MATKATRAATGTTGYDAIIVGGGHRKALRQSTVRRLRSRRS